MALAVCSEAGYLPAVVDVSHGAWGGPYWGAPAAHGYWGQPSLTTSHWGAGPWAGAWAAGAPWGAWNGPYAGAHGPHGPTTAYHADPSSHGHDG